MKAAVYALKQREGWSIRISIDLRVDALWWEGRLYGVGNRKASEEEKLIPLGASLPLGLAVKLRSSFFYGEEMEQWNEADWKRYVRTILEPELANEKQRLRASGDMYTNVLEKESTKVRTDLQDLPSPQKLLEDADWIAKSLPGRSLLESEMEALLAERYPGLLGHWRSAAQLAHLQGWLYLEAAVGSLPIKKAGSEAHGADWRRIVRGNGASGEVQGASMRQMVRGKMAGGMLARAAGCAARLARSARRTEAAAPPRCLRCGSAATGRTACASCGLAGCAYCEACLALGRTRACALLLRGAALSAVRGTAAMAPAGLMRRWGLSAAQAEAAGAALGFLAEPRAGSAACRPERFLLWAVTGAGKTEMIFPLLEAVLAAGGRALVATPRRDVVLELAPRLAKAFPAESIAVLYGGSQDRWAEGRLALATTHQLLRFHQAFDLVIIDELDAYPYHNDPMLAFAAEGACKPGGSFIYLSATPPPQMQREVRRGRLAHARVPVRFHGYPLPVPAHLKMPSVSDCLKRGRLPLKLLKTLRQSLERKAQIFLFAARIAQIDPLLQLLRRAMPGIVIEGTSSQDPERAGKVTAFRRREISLLVTTTILERGVTVPRSDVFVLDADNRLFDEASLVQMAGRAGRSKDDPKGRVVFASAQWNRSQRSACAQIRKMNRIARAKGYLHREGT
ncbi:Superfamily II DNA/RNA helicase required for DNA uptake (late competence protein) [Paenibacillus sophorae]|uniref:DNA/RNA helicase n=1 Tax=Paenibacillus sophorae TaxID=1333845 RepID=A0A1H8I8X3_9BACL|nr:helicase-related protein [Paenibacillus sophorae]QWU15877.1 DNA/RNA helicase [Paenibacillus sophorae]SEN64496.1 Superfamily II DNA/RNA helicase required for DNA uptake (late competence protein) [Paenibacillus sophorae]